MPTTDLPLPEPLPAEPFGIFARWFEEAAHAGLQPNPNAMSLVTVDHDGRPSARVILCKRIDPAGAYIVFFTNYMSRKGRALEADPRAAALFHWDHMDRQARIEGLTARSPAAESDTYFRTRPWMSRVGAWASAQSEPVASRQALNEKLQAACRRFGIDPANPPAPDAQIEIPRPPHWGGFRLHAQRVELWVADKNRLHDRAEWTRDLKAVPAGASASGPWRATRLQP